MVERSHVIRHRILPIIAAIIIIAIALTLLFSYASLTGPFQTSESTYVGKLSTIIDEMRTIDFNERQTLQNWQSDKLTSDEVVSEFTRLQAERLQVRSNLNSLTPQETFREIHQDISDANELWITANDGYLQGIIQNNSNIIADADTKEKAANQKFNSAIEKLGVLGYNI